MTPAEHIAAEVSQRYGLPVCPTVVQIIPRGVSAFDPANPPTWAEMHAVSFAAVNRQRRLEAAMAPKHAMQAGETRDAAIARLCAAGCTRKAIAEAVSVSPLTVHKRMLVLGVKTARARG